MKLIIVNLGEENYKKKYMMQIVLYNYKHAPEHNE